MSFICVNDTLWCQDHAHLFKLIGLQHLQLGRVCAHTHICTYAYIHVRVHTYVHMHIHTDAHAHIHTCTLTHTCTHTYTHMHAYTYIYTYACMHTYTHAQTHTHMRTLCWWKGNFIYVCDRAYTELVTILYVT